MKADDDTDLEYESDTDSDDDEDIRMGTFDRQAWREQVFT